MVLVTLAVLALVEGHCDIPWLLTTREVRAQISTTFSFPVEVVHRVHDKFIGGNTAFSH